MATTMTTLPGRDYHAAEVFDVEREKVFGNSWFYAGRAYSQGEEIYPKDGRIFPFMYPPSCAALLAIL